jgi:hypothetical protein
LERNRARLRLEALRAERKKLVQGGAHGALLDEWEAEHDFAIAHWEFEQAVERLGRVEQDAGIFHPAACDRLEGFVASAIELLDQVDGDTDVELNGDETDWVNSEDEEPAGGGGRPYPWGGPGCPISDPDAAIDDFQCDDIDQDLEPDEPLIPIYPVDQTRGALSFREVMLGDTGNYAG